jgi:Calx-beta domain/FG-GAP-like repeat/FG-GAP repeat
MWFRTLLDSMKHRRSGTLCRPMASRLRVEALEDRTVPAFLGPVNYPFWPGTPVAIVAADFNHDGAEDLAVASHDSGLVSVLLANSNGTFHLAGGGSVGSYPGLLSLAVGDFSADGNPDLAVTWERGVTVLLGNGDGTFSYAPDPPGLGFAWDPEGVAVGDFNADGKLDLAVISNNFVIEGYDDWGNPYGHSEGIANVSPGHGDGSFSSPTTTWLGDNLFFYSVAVADFNGDGFDDFATVGAGQVVVSLNDGGGSLLPPTYFLANGPGSVVAGDVNGDNKIDLVTANYFSGVSVLLGDGAGGFGTAQTYGADGAVNYADCVVLGDFNNDGNLDIATTGQDGVIVLPGRGDGTFSEHLSAAAGSNPVGLAAGDFNGDGWLDAATANNWGNDISVLINDHVWSVPAVPSLAINDVTITEGNTGTRAATFTVTLSAASTEAVTVTYATADGTGVAGSDYEAQSGTLTFAPGETTKIIAVLVIGDRLPETNETFVVNLSSPNNATIADGQGVGTVVDDEPRISISDVTKREGRKNTTLFTFTVTLSVAYDQAVTMSFRTVDGTATTGDSDYIAKTGTLTFAPGETTKTITIEVKGDSKKEANETFYLDLYGLSSNGLFTKSRGVGTILNDD